MSPKQLDASPIVNELKGSSLFFQREQDSPPSPSSANDPSTDSGRGPESPEPSPVVIESVDGVLKSAKASTVPHTKPQAQTMPPDGVALPSSPPPDLATQRRPNERNLDRRRDPLQSGDIRAGDETSHADGRIDEEQSLDEPRDHASTSTSTDTRMLARQPDSLIAEIRRTVRAYGKEVSYVRLTPEEKSLLADITYTYKRQGVKTSENEMNRIAVNFLLLDYRVNGAASILTRVIEALLA